MEIFEHRDNFFFCWSPTHWLAKGCTFNHQYHFLQHLNKQHILVLIWPQILIYCTAVTRDEFSKLCAVCGVVQEPGAFVEGASCSLVQVVVPALQSSVKFGLSSTKECNCRTDQKIMDP